MDDSLTLLLTLAQQGDGGAESQALRLVYDKLRTIARSLMRHERCGHTLQATALVSEVFLQKLRRLSTPIQNREHYYSLAAYAMRQVLIDHSRRARATRRDLTPDAVADMLLRAEDPFTVPEDRIAAQQAFAALRKLDASATECIRLRFLAGLTIQQTALQLHLPAWKVRAECDFGLKWMANRLGGSR